MVPCLGEASGHGEGWGLGAAGASCGGRAGPVSQGPSHPPGQEQGSRGALGAAPAPAIGLLPGDGDRLNPGRAVLCSICAIRACYRRVRGVKQSMCKN